MRKRICIHLPTLTLTPTLASSRTLYIYTDTHLHHSSCFSLYVTSFSVFSVVSHARFHVPTLVSISVAFHVYVFSCVLFIFFVAQPSVCVFQHISFPQSTWSHTLWPRPTCPRMPILTHYDVFESTLHITITFVPHHCLITYIAHPTTHTKLHTCDSHSHMCHGAHHELSLQTLSHVGCRARSFICWRVIFCQSLSVRRPRCRMISLATIFLLVANCDCTTCHRFDCHSFVWWRVIFCRKVLSQVIAGTSKF